MHRQAGASVTLTRRFLMGGGLAVAASRPANAAAPSNLNVKPASVPADGALVFEVSRNGSTIGTHRLVFTRDGSETRVAIDATFRVGLGFITLYHYHHLGAEVWRNGAFQSLDTTTNDNGRLFSVRATRRASGVMINAQGIPGYLAPLGALPLTHWAQAAMTTPLFNPQTGMMLRETVQPRGAGVVTLANGRPIPATRYALAGEAPIEDWYDSNGVWAALDGMGKDGSVIAYRRS